MPSTTVTAATAAAALIHALLCILSVPSQAMILGRDAKALSTLLAEGEVTAVKLMEVTLDRIDEVNPQLNAIVSLRNREELMEAAHAADAGKRKGWLHGIPIAIKDLSDTAGILSTKGGSPLHSTRIPHADDPFVRRLRDAGAIVVGKTNAPELGLGSHTYNGIFGRTLNPYDLARTPGGSSGGAAAALASRMLSVSDGSDMMGSLRNPAGWCNVYSLRPTAGMVDDGGEDEDAGRGENPAPILPYPISTVGPMARTPEDLSLLLETLAGSDKYESSTFEALPDIAGRRVGWLGDWGGAYPMEPGILEQCREALDVLSECGAVVEPIEDAPFPASKLWDSWTAIRSKEIADDMIREFGRDFFAAEEDPPFKEALLWEVRRGLRTSEVQMRESVDVAADWSARASELFREYDALALPSAQMWPFAADFDWPKDIGDTPMDTYHRWMEVVTPVTLAGLPCATVPGGFGKEGLPIGVQLFCERGNDATALAISQAYHLRTDWPSKNLPKIGTSASSLEA